MSLVPLIGGAYESRSVIAEAQKCVNLYQETNPKDAPVPVTHYPTPGVSAFVLLQTGTIAGPVRGMWTAKNGQLFVVSGSTLYYVDQFGTATVLGDIGWLNRPVSMGDNGLTLFVANGQHGVGGTVGLGWVVDLTSHSFQDYSAVTPNFVGASTIDYLDTFMLFTEPGTSNFYSTQSNSSLIDPTFIAALSGQATLLTGLAVMREEIWLLGQKFGEVWGNSGAAPFPFQRNPGAALMHGCAAAKSIAVSDLSVFWVGRDRQGRGMIFRGQGYECKRISTHSIERAIRKYSTIDDAVGFVYQIEGHTFYVCHFPSGDATWVFDDSINLWHQWATQDNQGLLHRHVSNCFAAAYDQLFVGDYQTGQIYVLDFENLTDNGTLIQRRRSWPVTATGVDRNGQPIAPNGHRVSYKRFVARVEPGTDFIDPAATIFLRWSDDNGKTWGNPIPQSIGQGGQYLANPQWMRLGQARYRVFELFWSLQANLALNGAFIDSKVAVS